MANTTMIARSYQGATVVTHGVVEISGFDTNWPIYEVVNAVSQTSTNTAWFFCTPPQRTSATNLLGPEGALFDKTHAGESIKQPHSVTGDIMMRKEANFLHNRLMRSEMLRTAPAEVQKIGSPQRPNRLSHRSTLCNSQRLQDQGAAAI
jgi:hypothetical protein